MDQDAYGHQVYDYLRRKEANEIVERDDGYFDISSGARYYFADYDHWNNHEKRAMRFVRGKVLDIGCGAGRVSLYLQERGFDVTGVDISPLAIKVCRFRGLKKARVMPITKLQFARGRFDTVLMLGNGFGLFGNPRRAKWLLRKFWNMTAEDARIIAESVDPYRTKEPFHKQYHAFNKRQGRLPGQLRIRVRYKKYATPWFDYLLVSKEEMRKMLQNTEWRIARFIDSGRHVYIAIIEKMVSGGPERSKWV